MIASNSIYKMLGLSVKAGGAVFGEGAAKDSIRANTSRLIIVAGDASSNTKKKFRQSCNFYQAPYFEFGDRYSLGKACGRSFAVVISITNESLGSRLIGLLSESLSL